MNARSRSVQPKSHALQLVATGPRNRMPASPGLSNASQQQRHLDSWECPPQWVGRPVSRDTSKGKGVRVILSLYSRSSTVISEQKQYIYHTQCDTVELYYALCSSRLIIFAVERSQRKSSGIRVFQSYTKTRVSRSHPPVPLFLFSCPRIIVL